MQKKKITTLTLLTLFFGTLSSQERIVNLRYGDMESWAVRYIKESALLGGKTKTLYVLGPTDTIRENEAYPYARRTIWGASNAYANVMGIAKGACTTYPEKRGNGHCARLNSMFETVKVLGMVDIQVAVAGTLFLGEVIEPVKSASDPYGSIAIGVPFTTKPKELMLDMKAIVSDKQTITKATGFGRSEIPGHDEPEIYILLQKRWEDADGNIHAKRVGTMWARFPKSVPEWRNAVRFPIHYGNITSRKDYKPYQNIKGSEGLFRAKNSKGKLKLIQEEGWGDEDDTPTHMILMMSAGCYPAFHCTFGNVLWIDNIKLVY